MNFYDKAKERLKKMRILVTYLTVGESVLSDSDREILKKLPKEKKEVSKLDLFFFFGKISAALEKQYGGKESLDDMKISDLKEIIKKNEINLSEREKLALEFSRTKTQNELKGLENKIGVEIEREGLNAQFEDTIDPKTQSSVIKQIVNQGIEVAIFTKKSAKQLALYLSTKLQDWSRDYDRIAEYNLQDAYQNARALELFKFNGNNPNVKFYKDVNKDACEHCVKLYTSNGIGSEPKLFSYQELLSNGNNIGVPTKDWKPVIGQTHPYCKCEINAVDTSLYEWKGNRFVAKKPNTKDNFFYDAEITINDRKFKI